MSGIGICLVFNLMPYQSGKKYKKILKQRMWGPTEQSSLDDINFCAKNFCAIFWQKIQKWQKSVVFEFHVFRDGHTIFFMKHKTWSLSRGRFLVCMNFLYEISLFHYFARNEIKMNLWFKGKWWGFSGIWGDQVRQWTLRIFLDDRTKALSWLLLGQKTFQISKPITSQRRPNWSDSPIPDIVLKWLIFNFGFADFPSQDYLH